MMIKFMSIYEAIDPKKTNLERKYVFWKNKIGRLLPGLPKERDVVFKWRLMRKISGLAKCMVTKRDNIVVKTFDYSITMSNSLKLSQKEFDSTFIHEMIHLWFYTQGNVKEGHGPVFREKASKIGRKFGLDIAVTHNIQNSKYDESVVKPKPVIVAVLKLKTQQQQVSLFSSKMGTYDIDRMITAFKNFVERSDSYLSVDFLRTETMLPYKGYKVQRKMSTSTSAWGAKPEEIKFLYKFGEKLT